MRAQTSVRCDLAPTTALGNAVLAASPGAILAITGLCQQQVTISSAFDAGITLTNHTGLTTATLDASDGVEGQLQILGPLQVSIVGILLEGPSSDLGYRGVVAASGATIAILNAEIAGGWREGLYLGGNAAAMLANVTVETNGLAGVAGETDGIRAFDGARAALGVLNNDGTVSGSAVVTVEDNAGNGVSALTGASVTIAGGTVTANGASQVFLDGTAAASLFGATVTQSAASSQPQDFAIEALQSSRLALAGGTSVSAGTVGGGVLAQSSSSLALADASISNNSSTYPTVEISGGSNLILLGGNTITNSTGTSNAIMLDHSSSGVQQAASALASIFAGAPVGIAQSADTVSGAGMIMEQSSLELGVGLISGGNSLSWTGSITATQNSMLRLSGGASVSGNIKLSQGSNGFFNVGAGGTNTVSGGITCPWSTVPSAQVVGPMNLSPTPTLATSFLSAAANQCLPF